MDCGEYRKLISRKVDGEATAEETDLLVEHLVECQSCRRFESSIFLVNGLHESIPYEEPPSSLISGIMSGIYSGEEATVFSGWAKLAVAAAAVFMMIVGAGIGDYLADNAAEETVRKSGDIFNVEYLAVYPPNSVGDIVLGAIEGGENEQE